MSRPEGSWGDDDDRLTRDVASTFDRIFGPGGTFDRIFGAGILTTEKKTAKKSAKKSTPKPLTTKLRLIKNSKCPRWADVWIQMLVSVYSVPRMVRATEEAADAVAMLLEAGWVPPNADKTAFHRWVDNEDARAYINTNESAEAEEVTNGSQDSQTTEEAPRDS